MLMSTSMTMGDIRSFGVASHYTATKTHYNVDIKVGQEQNMMVEAKRRINGYFCKIKGGVKGGFGVVIGVGFVRKMKNYGLGVNVDLNQSQGVSLVFKYIHFRFHLILTHIPFHYITFSRYAKDKRRVSLPIHITPKFDLDIGMYLISLPILLAILVEKFIFTPLKQVESERILKEQKEEYIFMLEEAKKEGLDAQSLLKDVSEKVSSHEHERNGLVINEAYYGKLPASKHRSNVFTRGVKGECIDVVICVQALVVDSKLVIHGGHKKV